MGLDRSLERLRLQSERRVHRKKLTPTDTSGYPTRNVSAMCSVKWKRPPPKNAGTSTSRGPEARAIPGSPKTDQWVESQKFHCMTIGTSTRPLVEKSAPTPM